MASAKTVDRAPSKTRACMAQIAKTADHAQRHPRHRLCHQTCIAQTHAIIFRPMTSNCIPWAGKWLMAHATMVAQVPNNHNACMERTVRIAANVTQTRLLHHPRHRKFLDCAIIRAMWFSIMTVSSRMASATTVVLALRATCAR